MGMQGKVPRESRASKLAALLFDESFPRKSNRYAHPSCFDDPMQRLLACWTTPSPASGYRCFWGQVVRCTVCHAGDHLHVWHGFSIAYGSEFLHQTGCHSQRLSSLAPLYCCEAGYAKYGPSPKLISCVVTNIHCNEQGTIYRSSFTL